MKTERLCNFYASKYHLSIILLEFLKGKKIKKSKIITFMQDEIEEEINILKDKYRYDVDIIKDVDFKATKNIKDKKIENSKNLIFIVQGDLKYIKDANEYILDSVEKNNNVKIINCYNFMYQKMFMSEIIKRSDKILFTTGEKIID